MSSEKHPHQLNHDHSIECFHHLRALPGQPSLLPHSQTPPPPPALPCHFKNGTLMESSSMLSYSWPFPSLQESTFNSPAQPAWPMRKYFEINENGPSWCSSVDWVRRPVIQRVWFPVREHAWVAGQVPSTWETTTYWCFSLSLSPSLPLSLNK